MTRTPPSSTTSTSEVGEIEPEQRRVVKLLSATLQKDFTIGPEGYPAGMVYTDQVGHPFSACAATKGSRGPRVADQ